MSGEKLDKLIKGLSISQPRFETASDDGKPRLAIHQQTAGGYAAQHCRRLAGKPVHSRIPA